MNKGYRLQDAMGRLRTRRFTNALDYSLDLIKLREVYKKACRRNDFSFWENGKEYSQRVINVTFKYTVKEWNRLRKGLYVRYGCQPGDVLAAMRDRAAVEDGCLVGIELDVPVAEPICEELLKPLFATKLTEAGLVYCFSKTSIPVVTTVAQLRHTLYREGFWCDGIHYVRFKRSAGSSRVGKCLFIDERLHSRMHRWALCGIKLRRGQRMDLAAMESYTALTLSSIIGTLELRAENILVMEDYKSQFAEEVLAVRQSKDGRLCCSDGTEQIENSIWDGQSLLDVSAFGCYRTKGMVLLRNRFFKSCCFNTNLQLYFAEHGITEVAQLNGCTRARRLEDIKLITTPSSIKYLKFGKLDTWLDKLEPAFGVVKHEKQTPYFGGRLVQTHYQLINTLQLTLEEMRAFLRPSLAYADMLRNIPAVLRQHIHYPARQNYEAPSPALYKNDVVFKLLGLNEQFGKTKLYHDFMMDTVAAYIRSLKSGHVLVNGNYSVLLGNPLEMLAQAVGAFEGEPIMQAGTICSLRFGDSAELLGSRSPHVCCSNIWLTRNRLDTALLRYMNLTPEIVAVNTIGENLLNRLSGSDFDSDTVLLTDDTHLIQAARRHYDWFKVPMSMVGGTKKDRHYTAAEQADLDVASSVNVIGEIINLAQELTSSMWHLVNQGAALDAPEVQSLYRDIVVLDILSGIEIDRAKKEFGLDSKQVLKQVKRRHRRYTERYSKPLARTVRLPCRPKFFEHIDKQKNYPAAIDYTAARQTGKAVSKPTRWYEAQDTAMDYLVQLVDEARPPRKRQEFLTFSGILNRERFDSREVQYRQVQRVIGWMRCLAAERAALYNQSGLEQSVKLRQDAELRKQYADDVAAMRMNYSTMYQLLRSIEEPENRDIRRNIFYTLFSTANSDFYSVLRESQTPLCRITACRGGGLVLFGESYEMGAAA